MDDVSVSAPVKRFGNRAGMDKKLAQVLAEARDLLKM